MKGYASQSNKCLTLFTHLKSQTYMFVKTVLENCHSFLTKIYSIRRGHFQDIILFIQKILSNTILLQAI